jgi:hypothetical protein
VYLIEDADARVGGAGRLVLLRERVEGRVFGIQQTSEGVLMAYLKCLLSVLPSLKSLTALGRPCNVPK